jgi:primary-amine oxidase
MKRWVGTGVAAAAALLGMTQNAWAVCTDPSEVSVTTVNRTFASGASWSIGVNRSSCEGLTIRSATYKPAGAASGTLVLFKGTLAEVFVPYHTGSARFLDVTQSTSGLGVGAVALSAAECSGGTLFDGNRICVNNEDGGYGWKFGTSFRTAQAIEIYMSSQLGQYNYINKWTFHDDGVIEPEVGLTGRLQQYGFSSAYFPYGQRVNPESAGTPTVAKSHMHNFYYRLDFDINGGGNDLVTRHTFTPSTAASPDTSCATVGQCAVTTRTPILTETSNVWSSTGQTSWVISDKVTLNTDGRRIGYELVPNGSGIYRGMTSTTESWTNAELWVTLHNGCERYPAFNAAPSIDPSCGTPANNLTAMLNAQSVDGQDLVVWYVNHFQHVPRDENELNMPIEWTGFHLEPRNFFASNPSP